MDNQQYLSRIYNIYADSIYRFLLLKTSSLETAEDLTSETFLRFVSRVRPRSQAGSDPAPIQNPRAFLYKTARNLTIDYYRKKGREVFGKEDIRCSDGQNNSGVNNALIIGNLEKVIQEFDLEKDISHLAKCLAKIPAEYAEVVILRYIEEMPFSEIAEIIEKSEGTVRVILHRGMKELRQVIFNNM